MYPERGYLSPLRVTPSHLVSSENTETYPLLRAAIFVVPPSETNKVRPSSARKPLTPRFARAASSCTLAKVCSVRPPVPPNIIMRSNPSSAAAMAAAHCGVRFLATIHADGRQELGRKPLFSQLLKARVFEKAVTIRREGEQRQYIVEELW